MPKVPRSSLRRLMFVVAILAIPLAIAAELGRRRAAYLRRVAYHMDLGGVHGGYVFSNVLHWRDERTGKMMSRSRAEEEYRGQMVEKYRHAARYPWLPVAPDPPKPE